MAKISRKLKSKLLDILNNEYEDCDFFMAASNILTNHIKDISSSVNKENPDFDKLRDEICEIGVYINNRPRRNRNETTNINHNGSAAVSINRNSPI